MSVREFVAVDLGATSGRVVNVGIDASAGVVELDVVRRFPTRAQPGPAGLLIWDLEGLLGELHSALIEAAQRGPVESVAIDSWGVDYGLIDATGRRLGPVHAYRSARANGVMDAVVSVVGRTRLYDITGVQFLPFNTLYQLVAAKNTHDYRAAHRLLMVPDLLNNALCGSTTNDVTNASTTQLLDVSTRQWSKELAEELDLRSELLPELHEPGTVLGVVQGVDPSVDGLEVVAAASHDTASAVAGIPLDEGDLYIICGTWALVGCELSAPITTAEALTANVTNELGVDGSVRLLKNVTGLWLLEECRRWWESQGIVLSAAELMDAAAHVRGGQSVIDPDDLQLASPGDIPRRIAGLCAATGQPEPTTPAEVTRVIIDSLALAWHSTVATVERVRGRKANAIHLVGGGASVPLLARLAASACERPVRVGPVEATVVGNGLVQGVAAGALADVAAGRALVARALPAEVVSPEPLLDWDELSTRLRS